MIDEPVFFNTKTKTNPADAELMTTRPKPAQLL